ncbi:MAG: hypothetical protein SGJ21_14070 [Alphaproteobacteria bacterium]|nr:hypothetical protein [Alphaproteobacteria bacterium]
MRAGDLGAAIAAFDHSTLLNPEPGVGYVFKAAILGMLGRAQEAHAPMLRGRHAEPDISLPIWEARFRRLHANYVRLDEMLLHLRSLWLATEPGA